MGNANGLARVLLMALLAIAVAIYWIWPGDLMPGVLLDDLVVTAVSIVLAAKANSGRVIDVPGR